jgi:uncharacterized protein YchJ
MQFRQGENPHPVFRTDRFCQINGFWYFVTREQTQEGPFPSRQDAQAELQDYIRRMSTQPGANG